MIVRFGDLVSYDLRASHGGSVERSYCIGETPYSIDGSHPVLACPRYPDGMPIHEHHVTLISSGHTEIAAPLREAHLSRHPGWLKPLEAA